MNKGIKTVLKANNELSILADRLTTALMFYANPNSWQRGKSPHGASFGAVPAELDRGKVARKALAYD